jgi:hypothetical protein
LKPLEQRGLIELWDNMRIKTGVDWQREMVNALTSAKIEILLVNVPYGLNVNFAVGCQYKISFRLYVWSKVTIWVGISLILPLHAMEN